MNRYIAATILGISAPFTLWSSTLLGDFDCKVNRTAEGIEVHPIGHKSDAYPLLLILGVVQGAGAYLLLKKGDTAPPSTPSTPSSIPAPSEPFNLDLEGGDEEYNWITDFYQYPAILIWGAMGSGKSTFSEWLVEQRVGNGHQLVALDPHASYGQWENLGIEPIGKGQDYDACNKALLRIMQECKTRYQKRANIPNYNPPPLTILVEEFTQWSDHCEAAGDFIKVALSDFRKVEIYLVAISHARTMIALGGGKGLAKTRDNSFLELQLLSAPDKENGGKVSPTFKGYLKYPSEEPQIVRINPQWKPSKGLANTRTNPEPTPKPGSESVKPLNRNQDGGFPLFPIDGSEDGSGAESYYSPDDMTRARINLLRSEGLNQTQIIETIWGVKKGGSKGYKRALSEFKRIMED